MDLRAYFGERTPVIDAVLEKVLPPASTPPTALHEAMRHLVFPGGKRLRPVLALASAEAVGGRLEDALPVAAAVELIHTYSLIHDDLPCMDDDATRRGRPSVHVAFGEANAVLAGDALQALAFEVLAGNSAASPAALLSATADLAAAAGARNLVGGQVDDLVFDAEGSESAAVESVHARKSAALIAAACVGGARLAGADSGTLARLRRFGDSMGVAFQIADDLIDADDLEPCSMVRAVGERAARERATELLEAALREVEDLGDRAEPLRALARFAVWREE